MHVRGLQGSIRGLQPGEGHRDTHCCWRRAQGYCLSLGLGSSRGFGSLGAAACSGEVLRLSSICSGWTPRDIWEFCIHRSFLSPPPVSLPPGWFGPLICHGILEGVPGMCRPVLPPPGAPSGAVLVVANPALKKAQLLNVAALPLPRAACSKAELG